MGLAFDINHYGADLRARFGHCVLQRLGGILGDGLLVAGTATVFAATAIYRYGWNAMTDSGQSLRLVLEFVCFYLFLALGLATAWTLARRLFDPEAALERNWMHAYLISVTLLVAVIAVVPPVWD